MNYQEMKAKYFSVVVLLGILLTCTCVQGGVDASQITESVVDEISSEVPASHLPTIRVFANGTVGELKNITTLNKKTREIIVQSILRRVREIHKYKTMSSKQFEKRLQRILTQSQKNLNAVTPEMLSRDWKALREQYRDDTNKTQKIVEVFFQSYPVVVLDPYSRINESKKSATTEKSKDVLTPEKQQQERRSEERMKVIQRKFIADITQQMEHLRKRMEGYLGDVYVLNRIKYQKPLNKSKAAHLENFLKKKFLVDKNTIVIFSLEQSTVAVDIRNWLMGQNFPKPLTQKKRFQKIKDAYKHLEISNLLSKPVKDLIITFGGKVEDDILDGTKFGFVSLIPRRKDGTYLTPREQMQLSQIRFKKREKFKPAFQRWVYGMVGQIKRSGSIESRMISDTAKRIIGKLSSLKEFYGEKEVDQVTFSPIEQQFLELLRVAVTNAPLFVKSEIPARFQSIYYRRFLSQSVGKKVPSEERDYNPKLQKEWAVVDQKPYANLIGEIQKQLDQESSKPKYNALKAQCHLRKKAYIAILICRYWERGLDINIKKKAVVLFEKDEEERRGRVLSHFLKRYTPDVVGPCAGRQRKEALTDWDPIMLEYLIYCYKKKLHLFSEKNDKRTYLHRPTDIAIDEYLSSGNIDPQELVLRKKVFAAMDKLYIQGISTPAAPEITPKQNRPEEPVKTKTEEPVSQLQEAISIEHKKDHSRHPVQKKGAVTPPQEKASYGIWLILSGVIASLLMGVYFFKK